MVHGYLLNGLSIRTGDVICTKNGNEIYLSGHFWFLVGMLIPGEIDHVAIYIGPGGRCIEAGAKGCVIDFYVRNNQWDAKAMGPDRGGLLDRFFGVAYPLSGKNFEPDREETIRQEVAHYCLEQVKQRKPYNLNFLNSQIEEAFYCSQLIYKAYLKCGIDLNTGIGVPNIPGTESIIFPQEIWNSCDHKTA